MRKRLLTWLAAAMVLAVSAPAAANSFSPMFNTFGGTHENLWLTGMKKAEGTGKGSPARKEAPTGEAGKAAAPKGAGSGTEQKGASIQCECPLDKTPEK